MLLSRAWSTLDVALGGPMLLAAAVLFVAIARRVRREAREATARNDRAPSRSRGLRARKP